ncbi:hypothetical protein RB653_002395 [Dictyostelium firmibasis]|uniref:PH domain-containing protein n=1 Tax=Dictyostelium firmibasis TaxID=79012 RepID=A0AAN7TQL3_9MYCE
MSSVRAQFAEVQEQLNQVHSLVDSNTPSDLNKAATILKSLLPVYKDLSGNEESKRPENLEILKEIKSRLTEETQRVMNKKEEAKSLQLQQQQQQQQQLQQQQQQQILESTTRNRQASQQELPKPQMLCGYLKKQGDKGLVRSFKKRWFQQRDTKLFYYEKEGDSEPYGLVNLPDMISVKTVDSGFELATPSRVYIFQVFKPSDLTYWTEGLKEFKKYYQSLQNSQKFGSGSGSPGGMSSSGSHSDFRKNTESSPQPLNSSTGGINTTPQRGTPIKDRRGTVSGGTEYSHSSSSTAPDSPTLSSSYAPSPSSGLNSQDEELKRRENEIIRKHQEKLKQEEQDQQQPPSQSEQIQSQPSQQQQQPPQISPQNSRHGSTNYSQQQQQQQQQQPTSQQSSPQVIISNNNSPRFESSQPNHHGSNNNVNLESFRQSIEDELNKKFMKEKQDLMEFEIKKRLEIESEIKKLQLQLDQTKADNEEKHNKSSGDLKKKKEEIDELEAQVNIITKRNQEMDIKIKELESSRPVETFPHEFLWTEEVNSRDLKISSQSKRIIELEEQLKLKDNAVTVIKRENEMLRQETEKKDKYINELLEKGGGTSGGSGVHGGNTMADNKIKESMVAHQTQNAFLLQEIQRLETQSQFKLDIKIQQIEELENQLEQQLYQFHRFREAIIGTMSNEYCDKIERENLEIKKEYFQTLGVSIKLHRVKEGYFANIDINSLFERVIKENVHYRNWPEWISNQFKQA